MSKQTWLATTIIAAINCSLFGQGVPTLRPAPDSADTKMAALVSQIPGFGGLFYEHGQPTVFLVGSEGLQAARNQFGAGVRVLAGQYDFRQLVEWKSQLSSALSLPGAVFLDADESRNRVVIGIDRTGGAQLRSTFANHVVSRGVPSAAVIIQDVDPIMPTSTLQDYIHPQPGGVQVLFTDANGTHACTLGFNVGFEAGSGFVTCSHCTYVQGELDGDNVGYGVEERDPDYLSTYPGCPSFRRCRYSDSALIYYAYVTEQGAGGAIANPTDSASCSAGSITISSTQPSLAVKSSGGSLSVGNTVEKIGEASGHTTGEVTNTCADVAEGTSDIVLLCQDIASLYIQAGDSGSPVFHQGTGGVIVDGIAWGTGGSCNLVFSPMSGIQYDIGPFTLATN